MTKLEMVEYVRDSYVAEDVEEVETSGWITKPDGITTRVPRRDREVKPVY